MIISKKDWETLEKMNQTLIQKWEALQHTHQHGNEKEVLAAEMQYLCALQNVNSIVEIAINPANRTDDR